MKSTMITKLYLKGFKSFANKTEILFGDNFNCVLGPNGSGKSNVLDALCFVLGKAGAKGLRAEKTANLIYNGGKTKNPASSGEVSIFFKNVSRIFPAELDEIKITRIIKGNGQSVYKLNDKEVTRQQILDFLSAARINPDGHNIILQGDIIHLVEMSPIERRGLVEEVAGISVYEDKKEKAMRELQRVEEKLNEAEIILTERKTYLKELKAERDQAQKFKDLNDKIRRNKATILDIRINRKKSAIDKITSGINKGKEDIGRFTKDIKELEKDIAEKRQKIEEINADVEKKGEKEQVQVHKEVETLKVSLAVDEQRMQTLKGELVKLSDRKKELEKSFKELEAKIRQTELDKKQTEKSIESKTIGLTSLDKKLEDFKKKNQMEDAHDIDKKIEEVDKKAEQVQEHINKLREQQQNLLRDKDKYELKIQSLDEQIEKVLSVEKANKKAIDELKNRKQLFKKATSELSQNLNENSSLRSQLETARSRLLSRKEELSKLTAKSHSIRESIAGGLALQKILEMKPSNKGIIGTVSELGHVNSENALALEVAAGARIKSIVVENDKVAADCIKYLKQNKLGIATFLPLNKLKAPEISQEMRNLKGPGIVGLAVDLVSYDKKMSIVFQYVFGNTLVVNDVETARRLGIGRIRMVTSTGDLIETSGAMQGGYAAKRPGLGFQEKEVNEQMTRLEQEVDDLTSMVGTLERKTKANEELIDRLRHDKADLEAEIIKTERSLHLDSSDLDANKDEKTKLRKELADIDKSIGGINSDVSERNKELAGLKSEKQALRDKITELRNPAKLAELNSFEEKKNELKNEIMELKAELKGKDSEIDNILSPERESILKILKQHEKEAGTFDIEYKELEKKVIRQKEEMKTKEEAQKKFYARFKELFNQRSKLSDESSKLESQISLKNEKIRQLESGINESSLENAKHSAELAGFQEEYRQYEGVPLFTNKKEEEITGEIKQFEKLVQDIGAVNMKALEIYDKIEAEFDSLINKKKTLSKEREDVMLMINEIDSKKKELFMKTLNILNTNFQALFERLSHKGEASLALEDPNDPFNGGLLIKVRISGKKFLDIRSLSGGEKTLTALAFIFAVQEHEPAVFYLLDEVDAALDKRNSEKLAGLIRGYCKKAQYIMISHNDGMIGEADILYGVSMNEHGISKITSLKI